MTPFSQDRVSDRDVRTDLAAVTRSETYTWDGHGRLKVSVIPSTVS